MERVQRECYWPKMSADVHRYVGRCKVCQQTKVERRRGCGLMVSRAEGIRQPWETICVDLVGPLPRSSRGYTQVLTIVDYFTKFVLLFPLRTASAKEVARLVEENVFLTFGVPADIVCDNGVQFRSGVFESMARSYGVRLRYTALYHPRANPAERINQELKRMLRSYVGENHRKWDSDLAKIGCALRTYRHEAMGVTPYFVNFGREMVVTREVTQAPEAEEGTADPGVRASELQRIRDNIGKRLAAAGKKAANRYNLRRREAPYREGALVWRRNHVLSDATKYFSAKLAPEYVGPYLIGRKVSSATYELTDREGKPAGVWHANDLKPYEE